MRTQVPSYRICRSIVTLRLITLPTCTRLHTLIFPHPNSEIQTVNDPLLRRCICISSRMRHHSHSFEIHRQAITQPWWCHRRAGKTKQKASITESCRVMSNMQKSLHWSSAFWLKILGKYHPTGAIFIRWSIPIFQVSRNFEVRLHLSRRSNK